MSSNSSNMMRKWAAVLVLVAIAVFASYFRDRVSVDTDVAGSDAVASTVVETGSSDSVDTPHSPTIEAEILFPVGDAISISWRPSPASEYFMGPGDYAYIPLKARAEEGDELAAYQLAGLLAQCGSAFGTKEEMEAAIDQLQQTFTIVYPDSDEINRWSDPDDIPETIRRIRRKFDSCYGITAEQKSESENWLQRSADGGYHTALRDLAYAEEDDRSAVRLATRAWEAGDPEALISLSERYNAIYQSGADPTAKIKAYAAFYAYTRLVEAGMGPGTGHGQIAGRQVLYVQKLLDQATVDMLDHELDEAIGIARAMIESNGNCCFGM